MHIYTHTYTHTYHVYYVVSLLENSEKSNFFTCLLNVPIEHGIKYNSLYLFAKIGPCTSIEFIFNLLFEFIEFNFLLLGFQSWCGYAIPSIWWDHDYSHQQVGQREVLFYCCVVFLY